MKLPRWLKISLASLASGLVVIVVSCVIFSKDISDYLDKNARSAGFGKKHEAIADYSWAVFFNPKNANAYFDRGLAKTHGPEPDWDGAIADFDQAYSLLHSSTTLRERAKAKAAKQDYDGALQDATAALKEIPGEFDFEGYILRGNLRYEKNDLEGAVADYDQALKLYPEARDACNHLALAEYLLGHNPEALAAARKLLMLDPKEADNAHLLIWMIEAEDPRQREAANTDLRTYLNDTEYKPAPWMAAIGRYLDGDTAENDFLQIIEKNPATSDRPGLCYLLVGIKGVLRGDTATALKYLQQSNRLRINKSTGKPDPIVEKWLKYVEQPSAAAPTTK